MPPFVAFSVWIVVREKERGLLRRHQQDARWFLPARQVIEVRFLPEAVQGLALFAGRKQNQNTIQLFLQRGAMGAELREGQIGPARNSGKQAHYGCRQGHASHDVSISSRSGIVRREQRLRSVRTHKPEMTAGIIPQNRGVARAAEVVRPDHALRIDIRAVVDPFDVYVMIWRVSNQDDVLPRLAEKPRLDLLTMDRERRTRRVIDIAARE